MSFSRRSSIECSAATSLSSGGSIFCAAGPRAGALPRLHDSTPSVEAFSSLRATHKVAERAVYAMCMLRKYDPLDGSGHSSARSMPLNSRTSICVCATEGEQCTIQKLAFFTRKTMAEDIAALREFHQAREASLASDLAMVRAELAHCRTQMAQMVDHRESDVRERAAKDVELHSALAASQLRAEQLSALVQDMRSELTECRRERQLLTQKLDAAREEFFSLQRAGAASRDRVIELEQRLSREKAIHEEELAKIRRATSGASSIIAMARGTEGATDPGYDAVVDTLFQVYTNNMTYASHPGAPIRKEDSDLAMARIATMARELDSARKDIRDLRDERDLLQERCARLGDLQSAFPAGGGLIAPSVKALMKQLEDKEAELRAREDALAKTRQRLRDVERRLQTRDTEASGLRAALRDMADSMRQVEDIRRTVRALIVQEANNVN